MRLPLLVLVLVSLVAAAAATAAPAPKRPSTLEWGNHSFNRAEALAAWLRARGAGYETWAARHPRGRAIVEHDAPEPSPPRLPPMRESATHSTAGARALGLALLAGAALLLTLAAVPTATAATRFGGRLMPLAHHRLLLVGVAAAIAAGAFIESFTG